MVLVGVTGFSSERLGRSRGRHGELMMKNFWERLIKRAANLAAKQEGSGEMLAFYGKLLAAQKEIYDRLGGLRNWLPSGDLQTHLEAIRFLMPAMLATVRSNGPAPLAEQATALSDSSATEIDNMLLSYWSDPDDKQFFAKTFLQPYARWAIDTKARPIGREIGVAENRCPFCGGKPQLSFVMSTDQEGSGRFLLCSACLSEWNFRRLLCASCGEQDPSKLAYYSSPDFEHVRIEGCDTCKCYFKGIDLTRLGIAVPLVDEVAAVALDIWAQERGYQKIELNMVGL